MHRTVYLARPDVSAALHSRPVFACLFSASESRIDTAIIAESYCLLDEVAKIPYELMGTPKLAEAVGNTLISAFDKLECLEQSAKQTYLSRNVPITRINKDAPTTAASCSSGRGECRP